MDEDAARLAPGLRDAARQLELNGIEPRTAPLLRGGLRLLMIPPAVLLLAGAVHPGNALPARLAFVGALLVYVALGYWLSELAGRGWAARRLRRTAARMTPLPLPGAGIVHRGPLQRALWSSAVLAFLTACFWPADGGAPSVDRDGLIALAAFAPALVVLCLIAVTSWFQLWRFGRARLVPDGTPVTLGGRLSAVLEANERLARTAEIRFDLVERHLTALGSYSDTLRATVRVPASEYRPALGHVLVPVSVPVPPEGWPSVPKGGLGVHFDWGGFYIGRRDHEHAWEVRASADVEGAAYRASFRVHVEAAAPAAGVPA